MRKHVIAAAAAGLLAACSGESAQQNAGADERAESLKPGEYELTTKVEELQSADKTVPATRLKAGAAPAPTRACVGADGNLAAEAFAEPGDTCTESSSYARGGRLSLQLNCRRPGHSGPAMVTVDGEFTADSLTAKVMTATSFIGTGDYTMTRTMTGKWVGQCAPAKEAKP